MLLSELVRHVISVARSLGVTPVLRESGGLAGFGADESEVYWSGQLGRLSAEVREVDGRRVLRIGDWSTVVDARTEIRHQSGRFGLSQRIVVRQPGRPAFVHRYRLPLLLQLAPVWEATYDRWSAQADDPGLGLVELLGGTDDWQ